MLLQGKSVVITGGAHGIGAATARKMADEGADIVICDIDVETGEAVANELKDQGRNAYFVRCDMSDLTDIAKMADTAISLTGGIDALINNAGITKRIDILEITPEDWDWVQSVNTRGMFFCLQAFARHMRDRNGGRIVNISSISGKGFKGASNVSYAASKAAAIVVARVAANELGRYNINVNTICPGLTRTRAIAKGNQQIIQSFQATGAIDRLVEADDIANAAVFLCSDMAASVTGQSINVDCGIIWD